LRHSLVCNITNNRLRSLRDTYARCELRETNEILYTGVLNSTLILLTLIMQCINIHLITGYGLRIHSSDVTHIGTDI